MQEQKRSSDATIDLIAQNLTEMRTDVRHMRKDLVESMDKVAEAMASLAKIEERQTHTNTSIDEMKKEVKSHEQRLDDLEKTQPEVQRVVGWFYSAIGFVITGLGTALAKYLGLF